jgi:UDP-N-acetyl-D-glucosamine dehydrogenase
VGVVGQGYVGLTLASIAADAGFPVIGIDNDPTRILELAQGNLAVPGVLPDVFRGGVASNRLTFTSHPEALSQADIIAICVPTPLRNEIPDLSYVERACRDVARHLGPSKLVILESTTYPGTTEQFVLPILESSGLRAGRDFLLAYSPERIDPGNQEFPPRTVPRIVGGSTPEASGVATLFYGQLVDKVVTVSSCRAAELAKLLENTFRHVNIALVNEMAMLCHEMEIDVWEVIDAAATKPFGFMTFHPGPGVGGHDMPIDPTAQPWEGPHEATKQFRILPQAHEVNRRMPRYVATRITKAVGSKNTGNGFTVLVLGISYKADVADLQESPALKTIIHLSQQGARVLFHDPYISEVMVNGNVLHRTDLTRRAVESADCVAILTPHHVYDFPWIAEHAQLVFDARNAYQDDRHPKVQRL